MKSNIKIIKINIEKGNLENWHNIYRLVERKYQRLEESPENRVKGVQLVEGGGLR